MSKFTMADNIPEEDEEEEEAKEEGPQIPVSEIIDEMWSIVSEGKDKDLQKLLSRYRHRNLPINESNEDFDEDGGHVLIFCVKKGCIRGNGFGRDYIQCARILLDYGIDLDIQDKAERTALHWSVIHRNPTFASLLLSVGADIDVQDHDGDTSFHMAVKAGFCDIIKTLTSEQDQSIFSSKDGKGTPALIAAVQKGHLDVCQVLLENGAEIDSVDKKFKRTALQYAVIQKRQEIFDLLLKYKPRLDKADHKGKTALHRICATKDPRYFQKVLRVYGSFPGHLMEQEAEDGVTPVILACQNGNSQQLKELLEQGASVTAVDDSGRTALHYCADNLETQCAEMLLMKDSSLLEIKDSQGFTPLHMSVISGNAPMLKLLLKKGADLKSLDNELHTPAHWATVCGHLEILDILIEAGAELSTPDSHNAYPIHYAAQMNGKDNGHSDQKIGEKVLKKLLDSGVPHGVTDKDGRQPLLWAASAGNIESCRLLVKAGADANAIDKDGLSAIHCAASRGHTKCVDELKKLGSDVNLADKNNCTALFYSITLGNKECTKTLLKYGADPNHRDVRGRTPGHCASVKGCIETVKMLDKSKADLWDSSARGDCPIHEAAQGGHCDVVKYLLKWKNSPDAVNTANSAGRTCLHIAAIVNNLPLCKLLLDNGAERNAIMTHKDKIYTPYDAAVLKENHETAEYIKAKGGVTGGDIDNIVNKRRDSKSAKSRKSITSSSLTDHPDEKEEEENKEKEEKEEEKNQKEAAKVIVAKESVEEKEKKKRGKSAKDKAEEKTEEEEDKEEEEVEKEEENNQKETDKVDKAAAVVVAEEAEKDSKKQKTKGKDEKLAKEEKQKKKKGNALEEVTEENEEGEEEEEEETVKGKKKKKGFKKDEEAEKARQEAEKAKKEAVKAHQEAEKAKAEAEIARLEKEKAEREKKKAGKDKASKEAEKSSKEKNKKVDKEQLAKAAVVAAAGDKDSKKKKKKSKKEVEEESEEEEELDSSERERARLEAERLKKEAEQSREEAEKARLEAERLRKEAELAKKEGDRTKEEIEQARKEQEKAEQEQLRKEKEAKEKEAQILLLAAEEKERQRLEEEKRKEEEKLRKQQEEEAKQKEKQEEEARKKQEEEARKKQEEEAKKKEEEEEEEKKKKEKEEEKKEQERKEKEKKETARLKEEAEKKRKEEEELAKKAQKEKEEAAKKEEEAKKKAKKAEEKADNVEKEEEIKRKETPKEKKKSAAKKKPEGEEDPRSRKGSEGRFDSGDHTQEESEDEIKVPVPVILKEKEQNQKPESKEQKKKTKKKESTKDKEKPSTRESQKSNKTSDKNKIKQKSVDEPDSRKKSRERSRVSGFEEVVLEEPKEGRKSRPATRQTPKAVTPIRSLDVSPVEIRTEKTRSPSPLRRRPGRDASVQTNSEDEFELPDDAPDNELLALEKARKQAESREVVTRESDTKRKKESPLRSSKVKSDGRIHPGLLRKEEPRARTPIINGDRYDEDELSPDDQDAPLDFEFYNRKKRLELAERLAREKERNREKEEYLRLQLLLERDKNNRLRQAKQNMSDSDNTFETSLVRRKPVAKRVNSIQESVRRYQDQRRYVRQLHQLKRAQIYTGPMHDIVLFSKLMDVYKHGDSEQDLDLTVMENWDGYLRDQLRFVSHFYEDDRPEYRSISRTAKEQALRLAKSASQARRSVETRNEKLLNYVKQMEEQEQREREDYEGRISNMAKKTHDILDDVQDKASHTLADAKETNSALDQYYRRERKERLASSRPGHKERSWLRDDEENDARQYKLEENDRARKEKFKDWHRKKNEELRRKLSKVYGNSSSLQNGFNGSDSSASTKQVSTHKPAEFPKCDKVYMALKASRKSSSLSTITPMKSSTPKVSNDNSPRPKSMMSTVSGSRAQYSNAPSLDQELSVHMTEFGMRRVKMEDGSFGLQRRSSDMGEMKSLLCRRHGTMSANWTPKFDGDVRPRAGLVFVEPRIYDEFLREETQIKNATALKAQSRSTNLNNLTLDDDNTILEPVEIS